MAEYTIDNIASAIDFECNDDPEARLLQSAKNLLMLRRGELPYDRQRGLDQRIYDLTINDANSVVKAELERVFLWIPEVTVLDAAAAVTEEGQMIITCNINIDADNEDEE